MELSDKKYEEVEYLIPSLEQTLTSALYFTNTLTTSEWPREHASCNGVHPALSFALLSLPCWMQWYTVSWKWDIYFIDLLACVGAQIEITLTYNWDKEKRYIYRVLTSPKIVTFCTQYDVSKPSCCRLERHTPPGQTSFYTLSEGELLDLLEW